MNILITAIGSMSAETVITQLRQASHRVIGCDIHPAHWLYASRLVDDFAQVPLARDASAWMEAIIALCQQHHIDVIFPLTDIEVDVLSAHRHRLPQGTQAGIMSADAVSLCRDKYAWFEQLRDHPRIRPLQSMRLSDWAPSVSLAFPAVLKPRNGRSSEGLRIIHSEEELLEVRARLKTDDWIVQPKICGDIYTVDIVRQQSNGHWAAVARKELIRTSNGAGISVETTPDSELLQMAGLVAQELGTNGCFNIEFIGNSDGYFLMDINPRFSAGVEFSVKAGYDMVNNHVCCFSHKLIHSPVFYTATIRIRHYVAE